MWAHDFRVFFTPLFEVLFTFPSRYWFAVGLSVVFSLTGWSPWIHAEFLVFRATQVPPSPRTPDFAYGAFTPCGRTFQSVRLSPSVSLSGGPTTPAAPKRLRFGLLRVRSPLLAQSLLFSLPPGTEMFQFPGFAPRTARYPERVGCPIRTSAGQRVFAPRRGFSQLIASFFASESQGILHVPLLISFVVALPTVYITVDARCFVVLRFVYSFVSSMSMSFSCYRSPWQS